MATLSKHGHEIGRIEQLTSRLAFMSDGKVLKNSGSGWKSHQKTKPGYTPEQAFQITKQSAEMYCNARPAYVAYRTALHAATKSWEWRNLIHLAIYHMPGDADGVWSELSDHGFHIDLDEVSDLCRLYTAYENERLTIKKQGV